MVCWVDYEAKLHNVHPHFPTGFNFWLGRASWTWLLSTPFAFSKSSFLLHSHGQTVGNWSYSWCYSCLVNKPKCFSIGSKARSRVRQCWCPKHSISGGPCSQVHTLYLQVPEHECFLKYCSLGISLALVPALVGIIAALRIEEKVFAVKKNSTNLLTVRTGFLSNYINSTFRNCIIWVLRVIRCMYC